MTFPHLFFVKYGRECTSLESASLKREIMHWGKPCNVALPLLTLHTIRETNCINILKEIPNAEQV